MSSSKESGQKEKLKSDGNLRAGEQRRSMEGKEGPSARVTGRPWVNLEET